MNTVCTQRSFSGRKCTTCTAKVVLCLFSTKAPPAVRRRCECKMFSVCAKCPWILSLSVFLPHQLALKTIGRNKPATVVSIVHFEGKYCFLPQFSVWRKILQQCIGSLIVHSTKSIHSWQYCIFKLSSLTVSCRQIVITRDHHSHKMIEYCPHL